ncbi:HAD family hydrolase [Candidatus Venteria ishoeyi]|uniref:Phosphoglycolate phosphatase n=1 Tax=Candidatus Venteria ishoeyi TaxID=1899563 RepID=A0A1H6F3K3_9GAMM|nr:HAD-IA family hydrolase [Candidatus Venteria ishoeyi]MDM8545448.1 HAD-IA family hydrolase [Candidatus Venteria ishoeyi]SEH04662.1 Phosphoglycolate phosphatase [Candidatus Venteria ishoeyi]
MSKNTNLRWHSILFDLDGTLIDTSQDLAAALNTVLQSKGRDPLPYQTIRPWVSYGGKFMIAQAFAYPFGDSIIDPLWEHLVADYRQNIAVHSRLFQGMDRVLEQIESAGNNWGIVTNKASWLTNPLLIALNLDKRSGCTVSADSLIAKKPHPLPLLYAAEQLGSAPEDCLYIGDAQRDIEAGQRAGMDTAVALFGYLEADAKPQAWGADWLLDSPQALAEIL